MSERETPGLCLQCYSRLCEHVVLPPRLTARECEVLKALTGGISNQEIGEYLGLTRATVKVYLAHIYAKLGLRSRLEAALWAYKHVDLLEEKRG